MGGMFSYWSVHNSHANILRAYTSILDFLQELEKFFTGNPEWKFVACARTRINAHISGMSVTKQGLLG